MILAESQDLPSVGDSCVLPLVSKRHQPWKGLKPRQIPPANLHLASLKAGNLDLLREE